MITMVKGGLVCDPFPPSGQAKSGSSDLFHFKPMRTASGKLSTGDGAVQIGGYNVFVSENQTGVPVAGLNGIVCARVDLGRMEGTTVVYEDEDEVVYEQGDMGAFVAPLYKFVDGAMAVDYRPMPSLGAWEAPV